MSEQAGEEIRITTLPAMDEAPAGLYRYDRVAETVETLDDVDEAALERLRTDGFLAVRQAFNPAEVSDAMAGLMDCIAGRRKNFILNLERTIEDFDATEDLLANLGKVRKLQDFVDAEPRLKALCDHPKVVSVLTRLFGDAPALYANQALLKPPRIGTEKPWHQDNAYFNLDPYTTPVCGVWIALDEATPENGCMHVIPGSHAWGPAVHFRVRDWQLCDSHVPSEQDVMVPLPAGGCMFFNGLIYHGTPPNRSEQTRRALQFHYYPASCPRVTAEERLAVFGSEGKDVSC